MEPEDLLNGAPDEGPAGADELRGIVARASRRRWRVSAVAAAAALAVGGGIGYAVSNHSSPQQTVVAGSSPSTTSTGAANSMSPLAANGSSVSGSAVAIGGSGEKYTHLFTRSAGAVTIRGYQTNFTMPKLPANIASCIGPFLGPRFEAEVSTPAAVATLTGFETTISDVVKSVAGSVIGEQEGSPTAVVVAYTGSAVATVEVQFANGQSDQMTPVGGWSVLAVPYPTVPLNISKPIGTLQALGRSGQVLKSTTVDLGTTPLPENATGGPACGCPAVGGVSSGQTGGGAGAGSGVASSGSISSAGSEVRQPAATNALCPLKASPPASMNR
jgi:hypothetical protein